MGPQIYLMLVLAAAGPAVYGYMAVKQRIVEHRAYAAGERVGMATVAAATTAKATEIASAVAEGEALAPFVSVDKAVLQDLCDRSASCRDRKR